MTMSKLSIRLTQIEKTDLSAIATLFQGGFERFQPIEDLDINYLPGWLEETVSDPNQRMFAIRAARTNSASPERLYVVGICGLVEIDWISRHAKLVFIMVDKDGHKSTVQNHPATQSAFNQMLKYGYQELGLNRIWIEVFEHNDIRKTLEQFGFMPEGVRIDAAWIGDRYYNSIICSLISSEYSEQIC